MNISRENRVFHELCSYDSHKEKISEMCFWRLSSGIEVDFVIIHIDCAIESKASNRISRDHLKGLRQLSVNHLDVKRRIVVCLDNKDRLTEDHIEIINYRTFIKELWTGNLF